MTSNSSKKEAATLMDLLSHHDELFIYNAYSSLLGRAPDPEGMLYYLKRLRAGVSKTEVLSQLRLSKEGKSRQVAVTGLDKAIQRHSWLKIPVLGSILQLLGVGQRPNAPKKMSAVNDETYAVTEASNREWAQGRGEIACALRPISQLELNVDEENSWESLGQDPYFHFVVEGENEVLPGWYCIDLCIFSESKNSIAKFYLDTGYGFNETETVVLPYGKNESVSRIFVTEKPILAIRFDPKEASGKFQVDALQLTSISSQQAVQGMSGRVAEKHAAYKDMSREDVVTVVEAVARVDRKPFMKYLGTLYSGTYQSQQFSIDYAEWIEEVEQADQPTSDVALATIEKLANKPLISIIMPVYNTPEVYLRACIESVRAQSYPHWELCIADDASPNTSVHAVLEEYQKLDTRIRVVFRKENGHISKTSNSALQIATGDFVALLDHDDVLPEHALYFIAVAINEHPIVQVLYSDEDKIDSQGVRFDPHFKSDWNPDLFFSQNYVSHLGVYRRELLVRINGFRTGVEGSQDQDLLLRCLPNISAEQIIHIPRVLYHWRAIEGSTALGSDEKDYTTLAGAKALNDYFKEHGPQGVQVHKGGVSNTYRVKYPVPKPAPLVSLLIPTRDRLNLVETCVRSILNKSDYKNFEILILDNGSVESETLQFFKAIQHEDGRVRVLRYDHPFNYSAINNFGVQHAKGILIGLINNDIEVISAGWLTEMVSQVCRSEIGCVGAKLYFENDTIQHAGVVCSIGGVAGHSHKYFPRAHPGYFSRLFLHQAMSAVTAACLLVRREVYEEVGGLDEVNLRVAFNDVDFCLKVREAGYRNLWTPYAELYHYESISRGTEDTPEKQARFQTEVIFMQKKWGSALESDPFYNPNLTRDREDFSIKSSVNM